MTDLLQAGSLLGGYEIRRVLGYDDPCARYEARHPDLERSVMLMELLPGDLVVRLGGNRVATRTQAQQPALDALLARFLSQYRALAHIDHPAVIRVREFLRCNGTGYVVLDAPEGQPLAERLGDRETLPAAELAAIVPSLIDGLEKVHQANLLHRAISPEHVIVRPGGEPVLTGFATGAPAVTGPRQAFGPATRRHAASSLAAGYAALEQYSRHGQEGPWTDIYALGAVMYRCVTGVAPTDAPGRAVQDDVVPAVRVGRGSYDGRLLGAIDAALAVRVADRPRSLAAWRMLLAGRREAVIAPSAPRGRMAARRSAPVRHGSEPEPQRLSWALPAAAATAFVALLTWVDTGILRSNSGLSAGVEVRAEVLDENEPGNSAEIPPVARLEPGQGRDVPTPALAESDLHSDGGGNPEPLGVSVDKPHVSAPVGEDTVGRTLASGEESGGSFAGRAQEADHPTTANDRGSNIPEPAVSIADEAPVDAAPTEPRDWSEAEPVQVVLGIAGRGDVPDGESGNESGAVQAESGTSMEPQPFTVTSVPPGAVIRFADDSGPYVPGLMLAPGDYPVVAAMPGYSVWEGTIAHGPDATSHQLVLSTLPREFADALASGGAGPMMVRISPGSFRMGCVSGTWCFSNELPVLEVDVEDGFAISKHEVTSRDYDRFVRASGYGSGVGASEGGRAAHPVVNVNWSDALAYAEWLSTETGRRYRLPTELEWEYAARAGSTTAYSWGNEIVSERANCNGCGGVSRGTTPVGSFAANPWGLHDMHGNVWEWVLNCAGPPRMPMQSAAAYWAGADCARRVRRGGSWAQSARRVRAASRNFTVGTLRSPNTGFRVVMVDP